MGNVLIVDDSAFLRMVLADILSGNGYKVVGEAENGVFAIGKKEINNRAI
ncbi:Chemotaxis protein CheY [Fervidicola ferrireducens]|uniref:Stage 0 sporulation protein A homolog n=1 Tax=Fervidicola ferrireducens TaxID=520764 RepID=A0A140L214_9FIRM|nr:response regulator [Fervidicola ferrireducens]KXG74589.1 Chemotaxis protein CheY [Fervidicola ferrireducens]